jgi:hypothetical protein
MMRISLSIAALASSAAWAQGTPPAAMSASAPAPAASAAQQPVSQATTQPVTQQPVAQQPAISQAAPQPMPQVTPQQTMAPGTNAATARAQNMPQYNQQPTGMPQVVRAPAPPAPPTPPVKGLPADAPKLVLNGGIYSERRDMRMAIVNGNVVREGQEVNGVVVEQIRPEGVVLAYRGSRVHVLY